jgi:hypothetical protein
MVPARNAFRHPSFLSDSDKIPDRWRAPSFLSDSSLPPARPLPNQSDVNQRRKSPRCGSTQSLLNTSRATARVPKLGNTSMFIMLPIFLLLYIPFFYLFIVDIGRCLTTL